MRRVLRWLNLSHLIKQTVMFVFLLQFVRWFSNYWLSETTELVYTVLAAVYVIELLFARLKLWLRSSLQLAAVIAAHFYVLDWVPQPILWENWELFILSLELFIEPFLPYCWFGLAVWLIYSAANLLLNTREKVFFTTVLSVIALAIADSYTSIYLWDETMLVVVSGLILMINCHFAAFRTKHPHTWKYIAEYPWGIALTAGTLASFIALMGYVAPNVRPLLVDPYTAWNQMQGRAVNFSAKEDTQTALTAFRLNLVSSSGYGRDDSQLGGGFHYNYSPVFRVTTPVRSYWRGESKSIYTGIGWIEPDEPRNVDVYQVGQTIAPELALTASVSVREFSQHITMIGEDNPPKIFGAYPITRIDAVNGSRESSEIFVKNMDTGAIEAVTDGSIRSYRVTSSVPVISEAELKDVPAPPLDAYLQRYVQLPETLPERVYELTREITAGAETPYEKVKAIESYLRTNYTYTNTPDESEASSEDFVDRFLFEVREGYCDYFSTAMTVMVRTLDLPARWVKGYSTGVLDEESSMLYEQMIRFGDAANAGMELTYIVRNADAHSWVEVYFEGYGWVMFEPTPGFTAPAVQAPSEPAAEVIESIAVEEKAEEKPAAPSAEEKRPVFWPLLVGILILGIAIAALWILLKRRPALLERLRRWMMQVGLMREPLTPNDQIVAEFNRLLRDLKRRGLEREEHQTVREAITIWGSRYPSLDEPLKDAAYSFELAKYSRHEFSEQEAANYQQRLKELRQQVKRVA